jgi:hypothetical protein
VLASQSLHLTHELAVQMLELFVADLRKPLRKKTHLSLPLSGLPHEVPDLSQISNHVQLAIQLNQRDPMDLA